MAIDLMFRKERDKEANSNYLDIFSPNEEQVPLTEMANKVDPYAESFDKLSNLYKTAGIGDMETDYAAREKNLKARQFANNAAKAFTVLASCIAFILNWFVPIV